MIQQPKDEKSSQKNHQAEARSFINSHRFRALIWPVSIFKLLPKQGRNHTQASKQDKHFAGG